MQTTAPPAPQKERVAQTRRSTFEDLENEQALRDVVIQDQAVSNAVIHVFSLRIDGDFRLAVANTGQAPLIQARVADWAEKLEDGPPLFSGGGSFLGWLVRRGSTVQASTSWTVTGIFEFLWNIILIFLTGFAVVEEHLRIQALGFERVYDAVVIVPVQHVEVWWD